MIERLERAVAWAEEHDLDRGAALFAEVASEDTRRAAWVLSTAIALEPLELAGILQRLWPEMKSPWASVTELHGWPMVERSDSGWRIARSSRAALSIAFRENDSERFRLAHELLMQLNDHVDTDAEEWFVRGRTAFYLAGIDAAHSVRGFRDRFADAPTLGRQQARMWLAALALDQRHLLVEQGRALRFFQGFREYVDGNRRSALTHFRSVVSGEERDMFRAISLHLLGNIARNPVHAVSRDVVEQILSESVELSTELGLSDNEVMARHTLAWSVAEDQNRPGGLKHAVDLMKLNLARAQATGDRHLIQWCTRSYADLQWLHVTNRRGSISRDAHNLAPSLLATLRGVRASLIESAEFETAISAGNAAASILRDLRDYPAALAEIKETFDRVSRFGHGSAMLNRLARTANSIVVRADDAATRDQAADLLNQIVSAGDPSRLTDSAG